jgi:hypothetical protein
MYLSVTLHAAKKLEVMFKVAFISSQELSFSWRMVALFSADLMNIDAKCKKVMRNVNLDK